MSNVKSICQMLNLRKILNPKSEFRNPKRKPSASFGAGKSQNLEFARPVVNERSELYYGVSNFDIRDSDLSEF